MAKMSVDRLLRQAKTSALKGATEDARAIYRTILSQIPGEQRAREALQTLDRSPPPGTSSQIGDAASPLSIDFTEEPLFLTESQRPTTQPDATDSLLKRLEKGEAQAVADEALELASRNPKSAEVQRVLGKAYEQLSRQDDAIRAFDRACENDPEDTGNFHLLGRTLRNQGRNNLAIQAYRSAAYHHPREPSFLNNIGNLLLWSGDATGAEEAFRKVLEIDPDNLKALNNLGVVLSKQKRHAEALELTQRASRINPDSGKIFFTTLRHQNQICDWQLRQTIVDNDPRLEPDAAEVTDSFQFFSLEDNPERALTRAKICASQIACENPLPLKPPSARSPGRIRVGFFSASFCDHPVLYLSSGLFRNLDMQRFEVFVYSYGEPQPDGALQPQLAKDTEHFLDVSGLDDNQLAELARSHELDIAIDMQGYTDFDRGRAFSLRLAPVQINYLAFPGTLGADFIDYIVADQVVIPEDEKQFYTENVIFLPGSYMPTDSRRAISKKQTCRADYGLPDDGFVFMCLNNHYKIGPREFDIWMRVMKQVEGSVLWFKKSDTLAAENLRREAQSRGVAPDRLVFSPMLDHDEHLARHAHADLFIDTFNFNGHTTACEALWAGLPLVCKPGRQFASRVSASLLTTLGIPELITRSEDEYEALILELATDPAKLAAIRNKLALQRLVSPLFKTKTNTRNFEQALEAVHERHMRSNG